MNKLMIRLKYFVLPLAIISISLSCKDNSRYDVPQKSNEDIPVEKYSKISHVTFYIENSGSMFGYVEGATEFVEVVNKLAQYPNLIEDNIPYSYHMISGKLEPDLKKKEVKLEIYDLGSSPNVLKSNLTKKGLDRPSSGNSDLNEMFKIALGKAKKDSISILISDGIYDVGGNENPLNSLRTEVQSTTTNFIQRLKTDDIETLIIKLESDFEGWYHPANVTDSKGKSVEIKQKRPYYIWIFGNSKLLNKYFSEDRIMKLNGYNDVAWFRKLSNQKFPYLAIGYNNTGFRLDFKKSNTYSLDRNVTNSSFFNIVVDFSNLILSDSYKTDINNYSIVGNYKVTAVNEISENPSLKLKPYLKGLPFKPTHIITVASTTDQPETTELTISLNSMRPNWINQSSADDDDPFDGSTNQTFGFNTLIGGIEEAYKEVSNTTYFAQMKIEIKK
jgi:hypothetical protein